MRQVVALLLLVAIVSALQKRQTQALQALEALQDQVEGMQLPQNMKLPYFRNMDAMYHDFELLEKVRDPAERMRIEKDLGARMKMIDRMKGDLRDREKAPREFESAKPNSVFHAGADLEIMRGQLADSALPEDRKSLYNINLLEMERDLAQVQDRSRPKAERQQLKDDLSNRLAMLDEMRTAIMGGGEGADGAEGGEAGEDEMSEQAVEQIRGAVAHVVDIFGDKLSDDDAAVFEAVDAALDSQSPKSELAEYLPTMRKIIHRLKKQAKEEKPENSEANEKEGLSEDAQADEEE